jgi:hypothetical protein
MEANIPVPRGAAAVKTFLNSLRDNSGKLPRALKGGRVVLLGNPMPPSDACLSPTYIEGLKELGAEGVRLIVQYPSPFSPL